MFLRKKYNYIAMGKDGLWAAFTELPLKIDDYWYGDAPNNPFWNCGFSFGNEVFFINIHYTGDWKDSLHERPKELKPERFTCSEGMVVSYRHDCEFK